MHKLKVVELSTLLRPTTGWGEKQLGRGMLAATSGNQLMLSETCMGCRNVGVLYEQMHALQMIQQLSKGGGRSS